MKCANYLLIVFLFLVTPSKNLFGAQFQTQQKIKPLDDEQDFADPTVEVDFANLSLESDQKTLINATACDNKNFVYSNSITFFCSLRFF